MMNYKIVDNFLNDDSFKQITEKYLTSELPWFYEEVVNDSDNSNAFYFVHQVYREHNINSSFHNPLVNLINKIQPKALLRIKANLYPNQGKFITHASHIDYDFEHKGAIFYLNTNNGYTILEDGTKIESVANRILFFDAFKPHQSTNCTDQKVRVNINFNYF